MIGRRELLLAGFASVIALPALAKRPGCCVVDDANITLNSGTIRETATSIVIADGEGVRIENIELDGKGLWLRNCQNVRIDEPHIVNTPGDAISLNGCTDIKVRGGLLSDTGTAGISLNSAGGVATGHVRINDVDFVRNQQRLISGNAAIQTRGTSPKSHHLRVRDCTIEEPGKVAIGLDGCDDVHLQGNDIDFGQDNRGEGIAFMGHRLTVIGNTVVSNGQAAACLLLWGPPNETRDVVVVGNHFRGGGETWGQCIAVVPTGIDAVIEIVEISGNIFSQARNAVQGYDGPNVGGQYGIHGLFYKGNTIYDSTREFIMPTWPVRDINVNNYVVERFI